MLKKLIKDTSKIFNKKGGKFLSLTQEQIEDNWKFTKKYFGSKNTASASQVDSNSNVSEKSVAVMNSEIFKKYFVQMNRHAMKEKFAELGKPELAEKYVEDIENHIIYVHDETGNLLPYCCSISLYPFILNGTKSLDGKSESPKHLSSFCSTFPNFIYQIASNFSGAVATVEFLMMFDYFARKDFGDDYLINNGVEVAQHFQSVVYSLNQPAVARGNQSVFWNISIFDEFYFKGMFDEMVFPDGSVPKYSSIAKLQEYFMEWFRAERLIRPLTFPVITASMLQTKDKKPKDEKFFDMITTQMGKGHSFFIYNSENADSLSSCCRVKNEIQDNEFSYTLGAGGVMTGSCNVITLNMNRIEQSDVELSDVLDRVYQYQIAQRAIYQDVINNQGLPAFEGDFISLDKLYSTIGINGLLEASEFLKVPIEEYAPKILGLVKAKNKAIREELNLGFRFNTEIVPF